MKRALIIGIGGTDGSYLAEILLEKGYKVFGTVRKSSVDNLSRIRNIRDQIEYIYPVELTDQFSIYHALVASRPDEVYHMADQDSVGYSKDVPGYSYDVTVKGTVNVLESVAHVCKAAKVFVPTSATIFGNSIGPQDENSACYPQSPYACAKLAVRHIAHYYRERGLKIYVGIMYNHHSDRRKPGYLLGDIQSKVRGASNKSTITVGSLEQIVDIGYAQEFMNGVYAFMQTETPTDLIFATGKGFSIARVVESCKEHWKKHDVKVVATPELAHDSSAVELFGDIIKAQQLIGWFPRFHALNMWAHI